MTTHDLRAISGESQREFAEHYLIPVATVRNWDSRGSMPAYLYYIIDRIQMYEQLLSRLWSSEEIEIENKDGVVKKEVIDDGEWWDKYSEAPDLYSDPYNDDCED